MTRSEIIEILSGKIVDPGPVEEIARKLMLKSVHVDFPYGRDPVSGAEEAIIPIDALRNGMSAAYKAIGSTTAESAVFEHYLTDAQSTMTLRLGGLPRESWWVLRDWYRLLFGLHTATDQHIHRILPTWVSVHVPRTEGVDPMHVAYTPDTANGVNDRKVIASLGKVLRKFAPYLSAAQVQHLESMHRAEMSDEVEFITDPVEFFRAYVNHPLNSCMAKQPSVWSFKPEDKNYILPGHEYVHPLAVYWNSPGVALAVIRSPSGAVTGRCITYVNPENEKDKRWVRLYGDATLIRRLERKGFANGTLQGARLKAIRLNRSPVGRRRCYLMPYLDPARGVTDGAQSGGHVRLTEDEEWFEVINISQSQAQNRVKPETAVSARPAAAGYICIASRQIVWATCPVTGERFDSERPDKLFVWAFGSHTPVEVARVPAGWEALVQKLNPETGALELRPADPRIPVVFAETHFGVRLAISNDPATLQEARVCPVWGDPDRQITQPMGDWIEYRDLDGKVWAVPKRDTCHVIETGTEDGEVTFHLRVVPEGAVPKKYRRVSRVLPSIPCYVAPDVTTVKTTTGAHAVPGVHQIVETIDGAWVSRSRARFLVFYGKRVHYDAVRHTSVKSMVESVGEEGFLKYLRDKGLDKFFLSKLSGRLTNHLNDPDYTEDEAVRSIMVRFSALGHYLVLRDPTAPPDSPRLVPVSGNSWEPYNGAEQARNAITTMRGFLDATRGITMADYAQAFAAHGAGVLDADYVLIACVSQRLLVEGIESVIAEHEKLQEEARVAGEASAIEAASAVTEPTNTQG